MKELYIYWRSVKIFTLVLYFQQHRMMIFFSYIYKINHAFKMFCFKYYFIGFNQSNFTKLWMIFVSVSKW